MSRKTVTINDRVLVRGISDRVLVRGIRVDEEEECDEQTVLIPHTMDGIQRPRDTSLDHVGSTTIGQSSGAFPRQNSDASPRQNSNGSGHSGVTQEAFSGSYTRREQFTRQKNVSFSPSQTIPSPSSVFTMDFDMLFENPDDMSLRINPSKLKLGTSLDEGVYAMYSFDSEGSGKVSDISYDEMQISTVDLNPGTVTRPKLTPCLSRRDSIMEQTMTQMLIKNWESSRGYMGFRRKVAKEINHKYCSYFGCDQMIFIFLYVVFGMTYICTGVLGWTSCSSEQITNIFLIVDGVFSVFVFPVTIMEWPKRIGGCVKEEEKVDKEDRGCTFFIILFLRICAAISGTVIMVLRIHVYPRDNDMCWTVFTLLQIGVVLEWAFMLFAMLLPFLFYSCCYLVAKRL